MMSTLDFTALLSRPDDRNSRPYIEFWRILPVRFAGNGKDGFVLLGEVPQNPRLRLPESTGERFGLGHHFKDLACKFEHRY